MVLRRDGEREREAVCSTRLNRFLAHHCVFLSHPPLQTLFLGGGRGCLFALSLLKCKAPFSGSLPPKHLIPLRVGFICRDLSLCIVFPLMLRNYYLCDLRGSDANPQVCTFLTPLPFLFVPSLRQTRGMSTVFNCRHHLSVSNLLCSWYLPSTSWVDTMSINLPLIEMRNQEALKNHYRGLCAA